MKVFPIFVLICFTACTYGESLVQVHDKAADSAEVTQNTFSNPIQSSWNPLLTLSRKKRQANNKDKTSEAFRLHLEQFKELKTKLKGAEAEVLKLKEVTQSMNSSLEQQNHQIEEVKEKLDTFDSTHHERATELEQTINHGVGNATQKIKDLKALLDSATNETSSNFETASNHRQQLLEKIHDLRDFKTQVEQQQELDNQEKLVFTESLAALNEKYGTIVLNTTATTPELNQTAELD